ncbi:MAG: P1 family peptidase [Solirubrobacterales bacterium]
MSEPTAAPPAGFAIGHCTDREGSTGCTVVLAPDGSRCGVDVRGGGPGTRETDIIGPYAGRGEATAVLLTGGSAYGLAAADGVVGWLEERGRGVPTPAGVVPIVPAAVVFDLTEGRADRRPGPREGREACEAAREGVPGRGSVGAGTGTAVAKIKGREHATAAGVGYAAMTLPDHTTVAVLAVVNAFGDVIGEDGGLLAGPPGGERTTEALREIPAPPWEQHEGQNTTLVAVMTDAPLSSVGCGSVARMASAGVARAVDPVFTRVDGDAVFCQASGDGEEAWATTMVVGTTAAELTAAAIRDGVRSAGR